MLAKTEIERIKSKDFSKLSPEESSINLIFQDLGEIKKRFVFIGFYLNEIDKLKYYEKLKYVSVVDLAEHLFGFSKSTTYSLININRMFCDGKNFLLPEYADFNKSQLEEMSSMLAWQTTPITSDFTVSEIRDYKKALGQGGFSYKGINFKEARRIINQYRADQEAKKQSKIPDVGKNETVNDGEQLKIDITEDVNVSVEPVQIVSEEPKEKRKKLTQEEKIVILFSSKESFSVVASKILLKIYDHSPEDSIEITYKGNNRPLKDFFPCLCNVLYEDILKYLNNPSMLDD